MARKTNKTDHLLNLLSGTGQEDVKGNEDSPVRPSPAEPAAGSAKVQVVNAADGDDPVAEQIRAELEKELDPDTKRETAEVLERLEKQRIALEESARVEIEAERKIAEEMRRAAEEAERKAAAETARAEEMRKAAEEAERRMNEEAARADAAIRANQEAGRKAARQMEMAQEELSAAEEEMERASEEMARAKEAKAAAERALLQAEVEMDRAREERHVLESDEDDGMEGHVFFNMMEKIVWDKAPRYMEQFGVCTCSRCKADIIALTLSKLPPRYVVVEEEALSPLKSFYEDRYAQDVSAEITKACIAVKKSPRHRK